MEELRLRYMGKGSQILVKGRTYQAFVSVGVNDRNGRKAIGVSFDGYESYYSKLSDFLKEWKFINRVEDDIPF